MPADGGRYYKETNQGMHGLAVSWPLCFNSPMTKVSVPRSLPGSASLVDPDYLERRPVMPPYQLDTPLAYFCTICLN